MIIFVYVNIIYTFQKHASVLCKSEYACLDQTVNMVVSL